MKRIVKSFRSACDRAGIARRLRPYDFRHAFVTRILAAGGDFKSTSQLAGHSREDTTMRIYQHVDLSMHRAAIDKLPPLLVPEKTKRRKSGSKR